MKKSKGFGDEVYVIERVPCKSEGCSATILPTTAAKTDGIACPAIKHENAIHARRISSSIAGL